MPRFATTQFFFLQNILKYFPKPYLAPISGENKVFWAKRCVS